MLVSSDAVRGYSLLERKQRTIRLQPVLCGVEICGVLGPEDDFRLTKPRLIILSGHINHQV